jgi:chromosome segregation ATPase
MATTLEQLAQKVAFLERELKRHGVLIDHQQAETDTRLADIQQHLDQQDIAQREGNQQIVTLAEQMTVLVQQVGTLAQEMKAGFEGMAKRLDWQDGQFAELRADMTDLSNRVAGLVQREGKQE